MVFFVVSPPRAAHWTTAAVELEVRALAQSRRARHSHVELAFAGRGVPESAAVLIVVKDALVGRRRDRPVVETEMLAASAAD